MRTAPGDSAAWSALLPDDTVWMPDRGHQGARRFRRAVAPVPRAGNWAIAGAPWACRRNRHRDQSSEADVVHSYVVYPLEAPILIAGKDAAVLRYVADSVLSVPPGAGRILSMVFTSGLRLLRLPIMWSFAAVVRATGMVFVGRSG
jgi:hypothetical protein